MSAIGHERLDSVWFRSGGHVAGFLIFLLVVAAALVAFVVIRRSQQAAGEQTASTDPLDPILDEVFVRPAHASRRVIGKADAALRSATPHVWYATQELGATPILIVYSSDFVSGGLLVVTTDQTLLFQDGRMRTVSHRAGTSTRIAGSPGGVNMQTEISGHDGDITFSCESLEQAQLICGVIDCWADNPTVRNDARVIVTPRRVHIPDEFFIDTLRTAGHAVTATNMRSIHERFGMMFINKARKYIESKHGLAAGERFTERYGRPSNDDLLPGWPARVLSGWIELEPRVAHIAAFTPHHIRHFLLDTVHSDGYLAHPHRPLSMWQSDRYENRESGAPRELGPGHPPVPA